MHENLLSRFDQICNEFIDKPFVSYIFKTIFFFLNMAIDDLKDNAGVTPSGVDTLSKIEESDRRVADEMRARLGEDGRAELAEIADGFAADREEFGRLAQSIGRDETSTRIPETALTQARFLEIKKNPALVAKLLALISDKITGSEKQYGSGYTSVEGRAGIYFFHFGLPDGFREIHAVQFEGMNIPVDIRKGESAVPQEE